MTSGLSALEWSEVGRALIWAAGAYGIISIQLDGARNLATRMPSPFVLASFLPVIPLVVLFAALPWWSVTSSMWIAAITIWIGGLVAFALIDWQVRRAAAWTPLPATPAGVVEEVSATDKPLMDDERPRTHGTRVARLIALSGAILIAASHTVAAVALPTSCEQAADLLRDRRPRPEERDPADWMPSTFPPGTSATDGRRLDLDGVVALRVDGDAGRQALIDAGFVDAYIVQSVGPEGGATVFAQRFDSPDGAMAFDAYATTYACRFATEAFRGPHGGVGMHIRYAEAPHYSRQASWITGSTRILVNVAGDVPILDDERLTALVETIP